MARKILLADDSVTAQNMGRKILSDAGYEVITVNNGSAALKKISEQKPDLIVLDVYMPGYSGLEVCQRLKEAQETSRIPVLLTVGKLEPFKPDEAKRVRAEGFIVKPFEASELLSTLSKLEDRIVPRSESSKPGRFARAIAAVEESGRSGRNEAAEDDSGWKNRISFPSKKKKGKEDDEETKDDPGLYNPVNRDLRTVVEREGESQQEQTTKPEESRVDIAALAPGLPKDVTAEEISALAVAAARVEAKLSAAKESSEVSAEAKSVARSESVVPTVPKTEEAKVEETKTEAKGETKPEAKPVERPAVIAAAEPSATDATFAQNKGEENIAAAAETPAASHADVIAAIAALEPANGKSWEARPENGAGQSSPGLSSEESAGVPVTMAAASAAVGNSTGPRWMAVPVAMIPEEAALSLEHEMQKAFAAFAAAEAAHAGSVQSPAAAETVTSEISPLVEAAVTEPAMQVAANQESELARTVQAVASVSAEAVSAAVTELAVVAASHTEEQPQVPIGAELAESAPTGEPPSRLEEVTQQVAEPVRAPERVAEAVSQEQAAEQVAQVTAGEASSTNTQEPQFAAQHVSAVAEAPAVGSESAAGGTGDMGAKRESDLAASTAAAWASWRQIRDSGDPTSPGLAKASKREEEDDEPAPSPDSAAMAVAAGAEKRPEEVPAAPGSDPKAIASIVDSVLAELRPKIVEEISRKLGEKK